MKTELRLICTAHASYPMLRMDFGDGRVAVVLQPWCDVPPLVHVPVHPLLIR